jgi:predicted amidohydrolase
MKALLCQVIPDSAPEADVLRVREIIEENPEMDLIAFPELFVGGYSTAAPESKALPLDSPLLDSIARACDENSTAVAVGITEAIAGEDGAFGNTALCFDSDGSVAGAYRKTHLFGEQETSAYVEGSSLFTVEMAGHRFGPMLCYDVEFPEPARKLSGAGAEALLTLASNMEPYLSDHELCTRARALDNRRHHLYVNRVGSEAGHDFVGRTRAVAPDGSVIAELGTETEGLLEVEIDLSVSPSDPDTDYLTHLRSSLPVSEWGTGSE